MTHNEIPREKKNNQLYMVDKVKINDAGMIPITTVLARFVADLRFEQLPAKAASIARLGFTDCIGVTLAGAVEDAPLILQRTLGPTDGLSTVLFDGRTAHPAQAAWVNGTAAHALDYDDAALRGHPSAVLVSAVLAEAQALGSSGRDMINAYVAGYETWAELAHRDDAHHRKGWHPTGIFGAIGAAAACAALRKLDAVHAAHALAIAASKSSGLMANFGSMTKPLHAGNAAHSGVMAARLADAGMTGSLDAIEHPQGFMSAVSPKGNADKSTPVAAGKDWHILRYGLNIKKYPMCYCTHRPIDALLALLQRTKVSPSAVKKVTVSISQRNATVLRNHRPQTGLAAKFSIEFAVAAAIIAGRVTLAELTDEFVRGPEVQRLFPLVEVAICDEEDPDSGYAPFDFVSVELTNGERLESDKVADAKGAYAIPLSKDELWEKFSTCAKAGRFSGDAHALFKSLDALDGVPDVRSITRLIYSA